MRASYLYEGIKDMILASDDHDLKDETKYKMIYDNNVGMTSMHNSWTPAGHQERNPPKEDTWSPNNIYLRSDCKLPRSVLMLLSVS